MAAWTLEQAQQHLDAWMQADLALTTNEEYRVGGVLYRRSDATKIAERIRFWSHEVNRLQGHSRRFRMFSPFD